MQPVWSDAMDDTSIQKENARPLARRFARPFGRAGDDRSRQDADNLTAVAEQDRFFPKAGGVDRSWLPSVAHARRCNHPATQCRVNLRAVKHFHFGAIAKPLFGTLHRPERLQGRNAAVLLCNPFGEEAVRAHRIYRVLAVQLARSGYPVLRFDYSGTGDSMGEEDEATLDDWVNDVTAAAAELKTASGARRLVALGLRLGGTLAALATARRGLKLRHLLLWDPVADGKAYLRELPALHREYMTAEMGSAGWPDTLRLDADGVPDEALGSTLTPALASALGAVKLADEDIRADHMTVVTTSGGAGLDALKHKLEQSPTTRWTAMTTSVPWSSDAAMNAAVVPMDIVLALIGRIEEVSP